MSVGLLVVRLLYRFYVCVHLSKWFAFFLFMSVVLLLSCRPIRLLVTFCGLAKVAILPLNFHTKHTHQIYEKLSYEALNRHFCQAAVTSWRSVVLVLKRFTVNGFKSVLIFLSGFACRVFFIFRRAGDFFNSIFSWVGKASSYHCFGLALALCGCGMCLLLGWVILCST